MDSLSYCYWAFAFLFVYLLLLLSQKQYRLILPSTIHTFVWLATIILIIFQLNGIFVTEQQTNANFQFASEFICYIVIASVIGFAFAHIITFNEDLRRNVVSINIKNIDAILIKFRWIPYICGVIGIILFIYIIFSIGSFSTLADYRSFAINADRTGIAAIAQRLSGHANVLGLFYLSLLGYKFGKTGINISTLTKNVLLCSTINMAIGGRVWILMSVLPILTTYILSRHYSKPNNTNRKTDNAKILIILTAMILLFSIIGLLRSVPGVTDEQNFIDKFLYFTDGSRITNMVISQYPPGSYELEYGRSEFLSSFTGSPMMDRFNESISNNIGLMVTVKSVMPNLYFDYGLYGGAVVWGFLCFLMEYICIRLKYTQNIVMLLLFAVLAQMMFQAPITNIFSLNTPRLEWIILIFIFRKQIFKSISNVRNNI